MARVMKLLSRASSPSPFWNPRPSPESRSYGSMAPTAAPSTDSTDVEMDGILPIPSTRSEWSAMRSTSSQLSIPLSDGARRSFSGSGSARSTTWTSSNEGSLLLSPNSRARSPTALSVTSEERSPNTTPRSRSKQQSSGPSSRPGSFSNSTTLTEAVRGARHRPGPSTQPTRSSMAMMGSSSASARTKGSGSMGSCDMTDVVSVPGQRGRLGSQTLSAARVPTPRPEPSSGRKRASFAGRRYANRTGRIDSGSVSSMNVNLTGSAAGSRTFDRSSSNIGDSPLTLPRLAPLQKASHQSSSPLSFLAAASNPSSSDVTPVASLSVGQINDDNKDNNSNNNNSSNSNSSSQSSSRTKSGIELMLAALRGDVDHCPSDQALASHDGDADVDVLDCSNSNINSNQHDSNHNSNNNSNNNNSISISSGGAAPSPTPPGLTINDLADPLADGLDSPRRIQRSSQDLDQEMERVASTMTTTESQQLRLWHSPRTTRRSSIRDEFVRQLDHDDAIPTALRDRCSGREAVGARVDHRDMEQTLQRLQAKIAMAEHLGGQL